MAIVHACQRDRLGGSPTAVVVEGAEPPLSDSERRAVPAAAGTSHAVFVTTSYTDDEPGAPARAFLRFFTAAGELPACGHGTVAALAVLAELAGAREYSALLRASGRTFAGSATRVGTGGRYDAAFDPGPVEVLPSGAADVEPVLSALGIAARQTAAASPHCRIASVGRPRLLVRVADRDVLAALAPDQPALRQACDRLGLLGCYVHTPPSPDGRAAARMFAPSIGVPEDIANANSTACLAACLAAEGVSAVAVDMGESLGRPSTITATTRPGADGPQVRIGGTATITTRRTLVV